MSRLILLGTVLIVGLLTACSHNRSTDTLSQQLLDAARKGNTNLVEHLLRKGADIEAKDRGGSTALELAVDYGHPETAELLMQKGSSLANADLVGDDALVSAARSGFVHRVEFLLKRGPSLQVKNDALFAAAEMTFPVMIVSGAELPPVPQKQAPVVEEFWGDTAKALVRNGATVDARDEEGATPLLRAAGSGNTQVVHALLDQGADVNAMDKTGNSAFMAAACECASIDMGTTLDSMKLLLERKANLNAKDSQGQTALMWAANAGRTDNARLLLDSGAKIDTTDNQGNSALMLAASAGEYNAVGVVEAAGAVKLLLARGADATIRNKHGDTAFKLAIKAHRSDVVSMLRSAKNH